MKGKLVLTVGISGSGKSTFSHSRWLQNQNSVVIVNRDKIRELLYGFQESSIKDYYKLSDFSKREKEVTKYEDTLINEGLQAGKEVIVDATHLKRSYLERFKYWNVPVELKIFDFDINRSIERDASRISSVGKSIITKQQSRFENLYRDLQKNPIDFTPIVFNNDSSKESCFIFDIDGTLAHMKDRSPYDWKRVFEDTVDYSVAMIASMVQRSDSKLIICTGRDSICKVETEMWLEKFAFLDYDILLHREHKDQRPDWVVKQEMWEKISEKYYIAGMFDDRLQVVRRARALGFKVFNVEYNNF